jgi:hypothetical protein
MWTKKKPVEVAKSSSSTDEWSIISKKKLADDVESSKEKESESFASGTRIRPGATAKAEREKKAEEEKKLKMKEEKCRFLLERGTCKLGDKCYFSHDGFVPGSGAMSGSGRGRGSLTLVRGSRGRGDGDVMRGRGRGFDSDPVRGGFRGGPFPAREPRTEWGHDDTESDRGRGRGFSRGRGGPPSRGGRGGPRGGSHIGRPITAIKRKDSYDEIEVDTTDLNSQVKKIYKDLIRLEPARRALFARKSLDIMFIIDCTGSMSSWIEASKREIISIIDCVRNQHFGIQIRVSIVAYRDHCDGKDISEVFDFSNDIEKCHGFISKLRAIGGGDWPEDIAGGFENGLKQEW